LQLFWKCALLGVGRVKDVVNGNKVLLDVSDAHKSGKQVAGASLIVGTRLAGTSEPLLANNGTSGLVVDVEVAGGVAQLVGTGSNDRLITSKHRAGQTVVRGGVNLLKNLLVLGIREGNNGQNRAKELLGKERVIEISGLVDSGGNVKALGLVGSTTSNELKLGVSSSIGLDLSKLVERGLVDHRAREEVETLSRGSVALVRLTQSLSLSSNNLLELGPSRLRNVDSRSSRALLALEFKSTSDTRLGSVSNISRVVDNVEVLTTGLTNNSGVASVLGEVGCNLLVKGLENAGGTSEVQSSKIGRSKDFLGNKLSITGNKVDNTLGNTSLLENLKEQVVGKDGGSRGLPHNSVTNQGRSTDQVTRNSSEIEGGHGISETLKRSVLSSVPNTGGVLSRLLTVHLISVFGVESEEVSQFASSINLSLVNILTLTKHGGGKHVVSVLASDKLGSAQEDSSSVSPRGVLPISLGLKRSLDSIIDILLAGTRNIGQNLKVGRVDLLKSVGLDKSLLAVDDERDLFDLVPALQGIKNAGTVLGTGLKVSDGLIVNLRQLVAGNLGAGGRSRVV